MKKLDKELISIIVPIYNVEEYLAECIESLINQTYYNIEILLINDGSTDKSPEIAENYAKKDFRIKIYHKKNGGLSDARNFGIDKALGKYITFVDSDDYVSKRFIEVMYKNLLDYEADISGCVYRRTNKRNLLEEQIKEARTMVWDRETALKKMLRQEDEFTTSACALLYKKDCFNNIRYPKGAYFEDLGTTYLVLHSIKKMVRTSECLYHYYTREGSISNEKFSPKYMHQYKFAKNILVFIEEKYPKLVHDAEARLVGVCFNLYMTFDKEQRKQYRNFIEDILGTIKQYRWRVLVRNDTPRKVRVACFLSYGSMPFCRFLYKKLQLKGKTKILFIKKD